MSCPGCAWLAPLSVLHAERQGPGQAFSLRRGRSPLVTLRCRPLPDPLKGQGNAWLSSLSKIGPPGGAGQVTVHRASPVHCPHPWPRHPGPGFPHLRRCWESASCLGAPEVVLPLQVPEERGPTCSPACPLRTPTPVSQHSALFGGGPVPPRGSVLGCAHSPHLGWGTKGRNGGILAPFMLMKWSLLGAHWPLLRGPPAASLSVLFAPQLPHGSQSGLSQVGPEGQRQVLAHQPARALPGDPAAALAPSPGERSRGFVCEPVPLMENRGQGCLPGSPPPLLTAHPSVCLPPGRSP